MEYLIVIAVLGLIYLFKNTPKGLEDLGSDAASAIGR